MQWSPDQTSLLQLATLLRDCMSSNGPLRSQAMESLKTFQLQPEFFNYLCYILIEGETDSTLIASFAPLELSNYRATAGMLLKNTILDDQNEGILKRMDLGYVKGHIVSGLYHSSGNALLTNVTGIVITTLFSTYYRQHRDDWSGVKILMELLELTSQGNMGSIKALSKIMEDSAQFFQLDWIANENKQSVKPIEFLVEQFFQFLVKEDLSEGVKAEVVKCLNCVIPLQCQCFVVRIEEFLEIIFRFAQISENNEIRIQICIALGHLLEFRPDKLVNHLGGIIQFMIHLIGAVDDEKVSIEACEFLHGFVCNSNIPKHILQPFVTEIVPVLLSKMVYDEDSILIMEASNDTDDAVLEDKDEDIKPIAPRIVKKRDNTEGGDDEDEDDDEGDVDTQWNLRKCSASTLDALTNILPRDVMDVAFPFLREHLTSDRWFIREATVLALGAMADGGMKYFHDQLPTLIPFLVEQLKDQWAPVRKMTCWTLSRFSPWILQDHTEFLIPVLEPILRTLLDKKKDVQESAISSVAVFIENCDPELIETLLYNELLESFKNCFQFYKKKNLIILYDAVGRFAEKVELDNVGMEVVLPPLINKWTSLPDNDKELWPLLECLSCVASSLGDKFLPMAPEVYGRAFRILCHCIELERKSQADPTIVVPEKDFVITSLDLIDGLIQGMGPLCENIIFAQDDTTLLKVMVECLQDPVHEVRQSTLALLGDMVYFFNGRLEIYFTASVEGKEVFSQFLKFIGTEIIHNDDNEGVSVVINAIWSLGIISVKLNCFNEFVIDMSRIILDLFTTSTRVLDSGIIENLGITIGRIGVRYAEIYASGEFASDSNWSKWCDSVKDVEAVEEKSEAFMGFLKIVNLTGEQVKISSVTLQKIIKGLSINVDPTVFLQDVYTFLVKHSSEVQSLNLSNEEITFLQNFNN